jgi:hypothetical protein
VWCWCVQTIYISGSSLLCTYPFNLITSAMQVPSICVSPLPPSFLDTYKWSVSALGWCCQWMVCFSFITIFVFTLIAVPLVSRVMFCPLQYCPTCPSKGTWNQGSPLLAFDRLWFLTLHYRRSSCLLAWQFTLLTSRLFLRFTPLDLPCSVKTFKRATSYRMWLFMMHRWSWAQTG